MGEMSDYFEDFPEDNPAKYTEDGQYDPNRQIRQELSRQKTAHQKLDDVLAQKGLLKRSTNKK